MVRAVVVVDAALKRSRLGVGVGSHMILNFPVKDKQELNRLLCPTKMRFLELQSRFQGLIMLVGRENVDVFCWDADVPGCHK